MTFAAFCPRQEPKDNGAQNIYNHFGCYYFCVVENFICCTLPASLCTLQDATRSWQTEVAGARADPFARLLPMLFNYFACNFTAHKIAGIVLYS